MLYLNKRFSVPAGPDNVSQEEWDSIFSEKPEPVDKEPEVLEFSARWCPGCGVVFVADGVVLCARCGSTVQSFKGW